MLDPNEGIEDGHPAADIEPKLFRMGCGIDFGIESLNRESETHRRRVKRDVKRKEAFCSLRLTYMTSGSVQLEGLGRVRQIAAPIFRDEHHVLDAHGAETGIVEAGLNGDNVAFLEK